MFSFGPMFLELWDQIPTIKSYLDYCGMANTIDDAAARRDITERDQYTLLKALELFKAAREIGDE